MKLKKLEIIGFKSFLDKASISFPPGVSAVVGPNGCGKSNIVDALRWVMGEQSVKQLRGKSKEDIIFAGANNKAPTNMAEVSITLLNDNGSAPEAFKDYSEIMVTRRLFRSGESAYLINKQPCRLKDVHDIFMGSGMGARTYSVIGQGNIGAITDAGPDERRAFVEEAAGVTRYKARKAETLSKIKSTNQNLLRVNDIITEVERQMLGLKRQAQKAERYKNYQQEIKRLDSFLLSHYYDDMSAQIQRATKRLQKYQDEDLSRSSRIKGLDAAVQDTKLKRWETNQKIATQKSRKHELERKADRAETELSHSKTDTLRFEEEIVELEDTRESLEIKNQRLESDVLQMKEKMAYLEGELVTVARQLTKENKDSSELREDLAKRKSRLETLKNELMQLVTEEARRKSSHQTTIESKEGVQRRLRRMDEEVVIADQKMRQLAQNADALTEELTRIKDDIDAYSRHIANLNDRLDQKKALLADQNKISQKLAYERNKVRSKYSALKKMADNFDWYRDGVKAVMRAHKSVATSPAPMEETKAASPAAPPLKAEILGITADVLDADQPYQVALDAVLGEALQYIIVGTQTDGMAAIDYLRTQNAGRSGFIPIKDMAGEDFTAAALPGQSLLLDHVRIKPGFETVGHTLLDGVMVVSSIEEAASLCHNAEKNTRMVTLAGEVFSPSGIMVGGSQDKLSGILSKKQELTRLTDRMAHLDQDLAKADAEQKELEEALRTIENELQQLRRSKNESVQFETETEKELYRLTEELKHAKNHLHLVKNEQEQLLDEEEELGLDLEKQERMLARVSTDIQTLKATIDEHAREIETVSEQLETFSQNTVDLKLKQTTFTSDLANSRNTLNRLIEFKNDGQAQLAQFARDAAQKREKQEELKRKSAQNQVLLKTIYHEIEALDQKLAANESDFQDLDAILKKTDDHIALIQKEREALQKDIRALEIELSEKKVKLENIENRCEERYHVNIASLQATLAGHAAEEAPPLMKVSQMEAELARVKARLASIGDVNLSAIEEYRLLKERYDFLVEQRDDLVTAIEDLHKVIRKINKITQERFLATFNAVNDKLKEVFPKLFEGGTAWLELTDPKNLLESGVEYMVQPAGKKLTRMSLLSGGEKALSAIAFIFSIFLLKPASFCLMDEIDAPLDDANVFRFNQLLKIIGQNSQIVMITHNKRSMEFADTLFGITMEQKGISKVVSVNLQNSEG
jgi:chromosome segregation protein